MNNKRFNEVTEERLAECIKVMCQKSAEYATDWDKLHNFKVAGELQGCSQVKALGGMMAKHTVSVYDLIDDFEAGEEIPLELWDEKIGDSINYLLLLNGMIREKEEGEE